MTGIKNLLKWIKPYLGLLLIVIFLTILNPLTYSYVPQFIKYVVDVVLKPDVTEGVITLPSFLIKFFERFDNKLTCILIVGITLIICQIIITKI